MPREKVITWGELQPRQAVPVTAPDGHYHPALQALRGRDASGVYAITDRRGRVLYIGESHTGRLYDTITRHFRAWKRDASKDQWGRRRGGTTYDRFLCRFCVELTPADAAAAAQFAHIQRLGPRDNAVVGGSVVDIPF